MKKVTLGNTGLSVSRLCLGGNVFGWSATKEESFEVLDAYVAAGGNFIDTSDAYSWWIPGNSGGESETIMGEWIAARGNRADLIIATKVAKLPAAKGLAPDNIRTALDASLNRLQTDYVDIYFAHEDDAEVPQLDVLTTFDELVTSGKARFTGASNFSADRLTSALELSKANDLVAFSVIQDLYNLMDRNPYESTFRPIAQKYGLVNMTYYSLARGFLTGKYAGGAKVESVRAAGVEQYQNERGDRVLEALGVVAAECDAPMGAVALAWIAAQPTTPTPIASARNLDQLAGLLAFTELELTADQLARLDAASS